MPLKGDHRHARDHLDHLLFILTLLLFRRAPGIIIVLLPTSAPVTSPHPRIEKLPICKLSLQLGLDGRIREALERPGQPKMAPGGPPIAPPSWASLAEEGEI